MIETVTGLFGDSLLGSSAAVFVLSMLPGIGLYIMIPMGVAWGLPLFASAALSILGNLAPAPFVIVFIRRIFTWMRGKSKRLGKIADKFESKAIRRGDKRYRRGEFLGLLIFVAVPIPFVPGTGTFTAAMIAGVLNTRLKTAVPAISIGCVISAMFVVAMIYGILGILQ